MFIKNTFATFQMLFQCTGHVAGIMSWFRKRLRVLISFISTIASNFIVLLTNTIFGVSFDFYHKSTESSRKWLVGHLQPCEKVRVSVATVPKRRLIV